MIPTGNFRQFLQIELSQRMQRNPAYSARNFALHLGAEPSYLSKILKGERPLGAKQIQEYGSKLKIGPAEMARFLEFHTLEKGLKSRKIIFDMPTGDAFRLVGVVPEKAVNELLKPHGLKAVPLGGGMALTCLAVQRYRGTNFGDYQEFYVAFLVEHEKSGMTGFTYDSTLVSSSKVEKLYADKLGVEQAAGRMPILVEQEGERSLPKEALVTVYEGEREHGTPCWKAVMGDMATELRPALESGSPVAFSIGGTQPTAYIIDISCVIHRRGFDPKIDSSLVDPTSRLGKNMSLLGEFRPTEWQYIPNFSASIRSPLKLP